MLVFTIPVQIFAGPTALASVLSQEMEHLIVFLLTMPASETPKIWQVLPQGRCQPLNLMPVFTIPVQPICCLNSPGICDKEHVIVFLLGSACF